MKKRYIAALVMIAAMMLACTGGPSETTPDSPKGWGSREIPKGPDPQPMPDHPPVPQDPDAPENGKWVNLQVYANRGLTLITGYVEGQRKNGPPRREIHGRIGGGGGDFFGSTYFDPKGPPVSFYLKVDYQGGGNLDDLVMGCKFEEQGWDAKITVNRPGERVHECTYTTRSKR